ncbi:hypothetical protein NTH44_003345 [Vibrio metoecus]|nr:hypothetical protein [Vibrio cholerae]
MTKLNFKNLDCEVRKIDYPDGQTGLELVASDTERNIQNDLYPGESLGFATVCLPRFKGNQKQAALRNYAEMEGILEALETANVVKRTGQQILSGYVFLPVVDILI